MTHIRTHNTKRQLISDIQPRRQVVLPPVRRPFDVAARQPIRPISKPLLPKPRQDITAVAAQPMQPVQPRPVHHPSAMPAQATPTRRESVVAQQLTEPPAPAGMTVGEHLQELRVRLIWSVGALFIGGALGYKFHQQIIEYLVRPLNQQLYYTSPTGGFDFLIKTCIFFGFLVAIPIIVYNIIKFIAPAVPKHVSYKTGWILLSSVFLALCGVAFAYFISLPAALHFLNNFSGDQVTSLISANEYFTFVMIYLAGFAALFQMPLIIAFINKITPLKPKALMKKQRMVILASFIIAAILTPTPDPINQTLMAVPIIGLYQSSIGVVWHANRRKRRKARRLRPELQTAVI